MPLFIEINSEKDKYLVYIPAIISIRLVKNNDNWTPRFRIFSVSVKKRNRNKQTEIKTSKYELRLNKIVSQLLNGIDLLKRVITSFKIKRFNVCVDTDDFSMNSYLVPLAVYANEGKANISVNYNNSNTADILITGKTYRIVYYLIRNYFKQK